MKLLVDKTLISYATPVVFSGYSASQHNTDIMPTFDIFDSYEPEIYLADADLLNNTVYKAIEERPALKVCVLQKTLGDHPKKKEFEDRFGNLYNWIYDDGNADLYLYNKPQYIKEYKADLVSIEDSIKDILDGLQVPDSFIFRIFSNTIVHSKRYCGIVPDQFKKNIFKSSKFSISENANFFNSAICDCFPFKSTEFTIDDLYTDKSRELKELKEKTLSSKTTFHFVSKILEQNGFEKEAKTISDKMKELL